MAAVREAHAGTQSTIARSRRTARLPVTALALVLCVGALVLAPSVSAGDTKPTTNAGSLVNRFFTLLEHKDHAGLQRLLSPAFQVQRADGSGAGKKEYLANLATITKFQITKLTATHSGGVLVVRYLAEVTGLVNGKPYTPGPAPRLSVFDRTRKGWQLVAHANFNPLTG